MSFFSSLTILVNRGWIPTDQKDPETRLEGQIEGEVEIEGILRLKEKKPSYQGNVRPNSRVLRFRYVQFFRLCDSNSQCCCKREDEYIL